MRGEIVSISNSSDPYPVLEAETGITRTCLEILSSQNCRIQIITKSDLVVRDMDVLKKAQTMAALSITTSDDLTSRLIEPNAPPSSKRLRAAENLIDNGIPVAVRIDPVIPYVNEDCEVLMETLASIGAAHITSSTYKVKPDNWLRFTRALPRIAEKLKPLYFERGERIGGYLYLPRDLRLQLMKKVRDLAARHNVRFGVCREGLSHLNTAPCDGSWLFNGSKSLRG